MSDDLIGFVADALDASEASSIRRRLRLDPDLARQVQAARQQLAILGCDSRSIDPPPGLADRTCESVFRQARPPVILSRGDAGPAASWVDRWRLMDVLTLAAVLVIGLILLFPAISNSRYHAQRLICQDHLRQLGFALLGYAEHHSGRLPTATSEGPTGIVGAFVAALADSQMAPPNEVLFCPGDSELPAHGVRFITTREINALPAVDWERMRRHIGGSFGYLRGFVGISGQLEEILHLGRSKFAILTDSPRGTLPSDNHGRWGANVVMDDGSGRFVRGDSIGSDHLFLNDLGQPAPGCHRDDAVLAPGYVRPWQADLEDVEIPIQLP